MKSIKHKILNDAKRWQLIIEEERKQNTREYFEQVYNKKKTVHFKKAKDMNRTKYIMMPKINHMWAYSGNKSAMAVYAVLCSRADFKDPDKPVQISRENIAKLAGISEMTVDQGIQVLLEMNFNDTKHGLVPILKRTLVQDGKRRFYQYYPQFFRHDIGNENENPLLNPLSWKTMYMQFHSCIVETGVWAGLSGNAKALYLAMRSQAHFDNDGYNELEGIYIPRYEELVDEVTRRKWSATDQKNWLERKWEVCKTSLKELSAIARIEYSNSQVIIRELEDVGLILRLIPDKTVYQCWFRPEITRNLKGT